MLTALRRFRFLGRAPALSRKALLLGALIGALAQGAVAPARAQSAPSGVERLYVLDCGSGATTDVSRWSPAVNVGKPMDFVDTCYLIKHAQGWMLWDTGLPDAVTAMPDGLRPPDPRGIFWRRPKTLAGELEQLGVKPADIRYVAVSHSHPDHIGNIGLFAQSMLLVQKAEYESAPTLFKPDLPATKLEGDRDVFGDGAVTIVSTPGHTVGHQSLLVKLPKTGAVMLTGDAVHFRDNWDNLRVPSINFNQDQTLASMRKIAEILAREKAQLWINHDKAQREGLKMAPGFYE